MASLPWSAEEMAALEAFAERRDWIAEATQLLPHRTRAGLRCMMQKIRADLGMSDGRAVDFCWMADAVEGSKRLLDALDRTGLRPL